MVAWHLYFPRIHIIPVRCHLFCVPLLGSITAVARRFPRNISNNLTFPLVKQGFNFFSPIMLCSYYTAEHWNTILCIRFDFLKKKNLPETYSKPFVCPNITQGMNSYHV